MKKIGNFCFSVKVYFFVLICFISYLDSAAQVTVNAHISNHNLTKGEQFVLVIEVKGKISRIQQPQVPNKINGIVFISNRPSVSQSYSNVNGTVSRSIRYSYQLEAVKVGSWKIPSIIIKDGKKSYKTKAISIVIKNKARNSNAPKQNIEEVYARLEVNKKEVYIGEQLLVSVYVYIKDNVDLLSYSHEPGWKAEGFWKETIMQNPKQVTVTAINVKGVRYKKFLLSRYALFATKGGELLLDKHTLTFNIRRKTRRQNALSRFLGGLEQSRVPNVHTNTININVKDLPPEPDNSHFVGAVGEFNIQRKLQFNKVHTGELVELVTTIKGKGNVALVRKPIYLFDDSIEKYNPKEKINLNNTISVVRGEKVFTDFLIARKEGDHVISSMNVSYFDPKQKKYNTVTLPEIKFTVVQNPSNSNNILTALSNTEFSIIEGPMIWYDSVYIDKKASFSIWSWIIVIPGVFLGIGGFFYAQNYQKKAKNVHFYRFTNALKACNVQMSTLRAMLNNPSISPKEVYNEMYKILTQFIAYRLNMNTAGNNSQDYIKQLSKHKVDNKIIAQVRELFQYFESINYAPNTNSDTMEEDMKRFEACINNLKKYL